MARRLGAVSLGIGIGGGAMALLVAAQEREQDPPMGPAIFVGDTVLKPYDPTPALKTKETRVDRAKYPATDIHAHWPASVEPAALLKAMDDLGVERAVNLSGGFGPQLDRMLTRYHDAAPGASSSSATSTSRRSTSRPLPPITSRCSSAPTRAAWPD